MKIFDYSHRHGKEIVSISHPREFEEIQTILGSLEAFPHGQEKNKTPKDYVADAFIKLGWTPEIEIPLGTGKSDYCDLSKNRIFIEQ